MVPIKPQFVMQNTYTHTHLKWKHGNLVAPENPCKFQRFSCILQCTLCPTFMITTPEVHTSLLSLVPINTLFIVRDFGSGKYSNVYMYVYVYVYFICICIYIYIFFFLWCCCGILLLLFLLLLSCLYESHNLFTSTIFRYHWYKKKLWYP